MHATQTAFSGAPAPPLPPLGRMPQPEARQTPPRHFPRGMRLVH